MCCFLFEQRSENDPSIGRTIIGGLLHPSTRTDEPERKDLIPLYILSIHSAYSDLNILFYFSVGFFYVVDTFTLYIVLGSESLHH